MQFSWQNAWLNKNIRKNLDVEYFRKEKIKMDYTQMLGNTNELRCLTAFIQLGFECSIPYGNGAKYDFIADDGKNLYRIQCKCSNYINDHGVIKKDAFSFNTTSQTTNTKETIRHVYSSEEIDYFATCFKGKVYVVPVNECKTSKTLRLEPPANGQKNYNNAEDYLITNIFTYSEKLKDSYVKYKNRFESQKKEVKHYYCECCGKEVSSKGVKCPECAAKNSRKVERPERDELKQLIRTKSFLDIGRLFGVTDNSIRKWCLVYNLPSKKSEINSISEDDWKLI